MDILQSIFGKKKRHEIVERLLSEGNITAKEAIVLLNEKMVINIQKMEMSSGAKIIAGDDNEISGR
jgi:hypothetical protein